MLLIFGGQQRLSYNITDTLVFSDIVSYDTHGQRFYGLTDTSVLNDGLIFFTVNGKQFFNLADTFDFQDSVNRFVINSSSPSETFYTSDLLRINFATPIASEVVPNLCFNPGAPYIPNVVLPNFPLSGDTIAYNMAAKPISLVVNSVGNNTFPAGLYVFYEKNGSIWYNYKTTTSSWTSQEYLLACGREVGIADSRTVFDCDGYPLTAYSDVNGNIGINYYIDGISSELTSDFKGTSPNVLIYGGSILLLYIPSTYTGSLAFLTSASSYQAQCYYPINIPNTVISFTVRQVTDSEWHFSFVSQNTNGVNSVYYAET